MQTQDPLNQSDDSEEETILFKSQVKSARIKSAMVATIFSSIFFITFITFTSFGKTIFPKLLMSSLFTTGSFIFIYQFVFSLGFGKTLLPKLNKNKIFFTPMSYVYTDTEDAIDAINMANGHGPGLGFLKPRDDW